MVEHIAALAVIGCCCVTIATVQATHHEMVVPARDEAYAAQVALIAVRLFAANPDPTKRIITCPMGFDQYEAVVHDTKVEVKIIGSSKTWTFTRGVHTN
jgi:hypothetical protein